MWLVSGGSFWIKHCIEVGVVGGVARIGGCG